MWGPITARPAAGSRLAQSSACQLCPAARTEIQGLFWVPADQSSLSLVGQVRNRVLADRCFRHEMSAALLGKGMVSMKAGFGIRHGPARSLCQLPVLPRSHSLLGQPQHLQTPNWLQLLNAAISQ